MDLSSRMKALRRKLRYTPWTCGLCSAQFFSLKDTLWHFESKGSPHAGCEPRYFEDYDRLLEAEIERELDSETLAEPREATFASEKVISEFCSASSWVTHHAEKSLEPLQLVGDTYPAIDDDVLPPDSEDNESDLDDPVKVTKEQSFPNSFSDIAQSLWSSYRQPVSPPKDSFESGNSPATSSNALHSTWPSEQVASPVKDNTSPETGANKYEPPSLPRRRAPVSLQSVVQCVLCRRRVVGGRDGAGLRGHIAQRHLEEPTFRCVFCLGGWKGWRSADARRKALDHGKDCPRTAQAGEVALEDLRGSARPFLESQWARCFPRHAPGSSKGDDSADQRHARRCRLCHEHVSGALSADRFRAHLLGSHLEDSPFACGACGKGWRCLRPSEAELRIWTHRDSCDGAWLKDNRSQVMKCVTELWKLCFNMKPPVPKRLADYE